MGANKESDMRCILCKETGELFTTVEHAVPESLGGGPWSELPPSLVCNSCQNYFGTKVERDALASHPFLLLRTLLAIPTKKRKSAWLDDPLEGRLESAGGPGLLIYEPSGRISNVSQKTVMRFPGQPAEPRAVCRLLLKMGIEALAFDSTSEALHERFDAARAVARGRSNQPWWYLECDNGTSLVAWFAGRLPEGESLAELFVSSPAVGVEMAVFKLGPVTLMAPLLPNIQPDVSGDWDSQWRLVRV